MILDDKDKAVLNRAITTYGLNAELLVAMEELAELSAVLAKIPRYKDIHTARKELYMRVLDEYVDVNIVLEYVQAAMGITEEDAKEVKERKLERLKTWLDTGSDIAISTIIRDIGRPVDAIVQRIQRPNWFKLLCSLPWKRKN